MTTNGFDYDVIIIGSGFGGSVAALRATEKGYHVGVIESGKRWPDEDVPKSSWDVRKFAWQPDAEMYGIQRIEFLDDVLVLCGAGVGGGSHHYAQTLYVPPKKFFDAPEWAGITDWADELAPYIDQARRMLGVVPIPYMDTQLDRLMREVAGEMGRGETYNKAPVGVYFGTPGVEADDPYFGGEGPKRRGCISCGNCMIGCGHNAKNKLTVNYLYLAEKHGAVIHELHEVYRGLAARGRRIRSACPPSGMDAACGGPPPPQIHRHAGDRLRTRLRFGKTAAPPQAHRNARGPVRPARQAGSHELRAADLDHATLWRLEARPGRTPHHTGFGRHHLGRMARRQDEHRAGLLRCRQRLDDVRVDLPSARRAEASGAGMDQVAGRAPRGGARQARRASLVGAAGGPALHADLRHFHRVVLEGRHAPQPSRQRPGAVHAHPSGGGVCGPARAEDAWRTSGPVDRGAQSHCVGALHRWDHHRRAR